MFVHSVVYALHMEQGMGVMPMQIGGLEIIVCILNWLFCRCIIISFPQFCE